MSFVAGTDWLLAQFKIFLAAIGGGLLLGCLWRSYSALFLPRRRRKRDWLLPDLVFSLSAAALLIAYWFAFTDGGLRPQDLLWLACGLGLSRLLPKARLPLVLRRKVSKPRLPKRSPARGKRTAYDPLLRSAARGALRLQNELSRLKKDWRERRSSASETETEIPASPRDD